MKKKIAILALKRLTNNTRIVRQASALEKAGYDVSVYALAQPSAGLMKQTPHTNYIVIPLTHRKAPTTAKKAAVTQNRWGIMKANLSQFIIPIKNYLLRLHFARQVLLITSNHQFDIVQAHDSYTIRAAYKLSKRHHARLVYDAVEITDQRSSFFMRRSNWLNALLQWRDNALIKKAALIFAVGPAVAEWTKKRFAFDDVIVVRNCRWYQQDSPDHSIIKQELGLKPDERLILFIGSVYPGLGLELLLESILHLSKQTHVALLGPVVSQGYQQQLQKIATELNVAERFHCLAAKAPEALIEYAAGADVGVIPLQRKPLNTLYSLPNKCFEMIMARLPIAVGRLPDISHIVKQYEIGELFNETDPISIASTLSALLQDEKLEQLKENLENAAQHLCWENESNIYINSIDNLLNT